MRYVFILIMSMSFSAHAEWKEFADIYFKDAEFTDNQRVSVQVLVDRDDAKGSLVVHMQYQCDNGVPTKEREFWWANYKGRMGTGNVNFYTQGAPWLPHEVNRITELATELCKLANRRFD
jgi:hypothetical protein